MKTPLKTSKAELLLEDSWRLTPARMAARLTNGRFQRYRHVKFLEKKLALAIGRGGARILITMPPRHGKSWLGSLFLPAWFLSLWPERKVILCSHDSNQAADWGREVRGLLREHQSVLGKLQGGGIETAGVGGSIAGRGGDLLIVDDPIKSWKDASSETTRQRQIDWFNSTLYTRAEPGASIVVIMTRWHERDLAGYLEREHGDKWEVIHIPALAEAGDVLGRGVGEPLCPERFGESVLERIRASVGSRAWNAMYQQKPTSSEGRVLKRQWWKRYEVLPERFDEVVQTWDLAFKDNNDYVVGQVWGKIGANKFLIDQVRGRMDFLSTLEAVRDLAARYPQCGRKLIEGKANGSAVVASLRDHVPGLIAVEPRGGKLARVSEVSAEIESGNVYLPPPTRAPWVEDFVEECSDFPNGKHDDQVDAMAYALAAWKGEAQ